MKLFRYGLCFTVIILVLMTVVVATAVFVEMDFTVTVQGYIKPKRTLPVYLTMRGRVIETVSPGPVEKGQTLIALDVDAVRVELSLINKSVRLIEEELVKERGELGNPQRRFSLKQDMNRLLLQASTLKHTIDQSRIRAPFAGQVLGVYLNPGEYAVGENQLALLLADDSEYIFEALSTPAQSRNLQPNNRASVRLDAYPYLKYGEVKACLIRIDSYLPDDGAPRNVLRFSLNRQAPFPLLHGLAGTANVISFHGTILDYMLRSEVP